MRCPSAARPHPCAVRPHLCAVRPHPCEFVRPQSARIYPKTWTDSGLTTDGMRTDCGRMRTANNKTCRPSSLYLLNDLRTLFHQVKIYLKNIFSLALSRIYPTFILLYPALSRLYHALSRFIPLYLAFLILLYPAFIPHLSSIYHALSRFITLYPALSRIFIPLYPALRD